MNYVVICCSKTRSIKQKRGLSKTFNLSDEVSYVSLVKLTYHDIDFISLVRIEQAITLQLWVFSFLV